MASFSKVTQLVFFTLTQLADLLRQLLTWHPPISPAFFQLLTVDLLLNQQVAVSLKESQPKICYSVAMQQPVPSSHSLMLAMVHQLQVFQVATTMHFPSLQQEFSAQPMVNHLHLVMLQPVMLSSQVEVASTMVLSFPAT